MPFSDYIVYVDESGDHGLSSIDPAYPVFVLALCMFRKSEYADIVSPALARLKLKAFGHDTVVLHSHGIRKATGAFSVLRNPAVREGFLKALEVFVAAMPFTIIATAIKKPELMRQYVKPANVYKLALQFCLERAYAFLCEQRQEEPTSHFVLESRGRREDQDLELEFRRICDGADFRSVRLPFVPVFVSKSDNCAGLQVADLVAHPIGRHVLNPAQRNRAFTLIEPKIRRSYAGKIDGFGLKIFP